MVDDTKPPNFGDNAEIFKAFDRERSNAHDLSRRYAEGLKESRARDRQVLIPLSCIKMRFGCSEIRRDLCRGS